MNAIEGQLSLDGKVFSVTLIGSLDKQGNKVSRLLLVAHHLVIDTVSWRIIVEQLNSVYDALLVEVLHGSAPLSRQAVETLKYKKLGSRRMVLAYMNVGRAASYQYYWENNWTTGYPAWIDEPLNSEPDHYRVKFWDKGWQNIITGNKNSYLYGIIAQGFDGVVIDGADSYKYYEGIN